MADKKQGLMCGASWCSKPSARGNGSDMRSVGGVPLCRSCYQYLWKQSKVIGDTMEDLLTNGKVSGPQRRPNLKKPVICIREGCDVVLHPPDSKKGKDQVRRMIKGEGWVCHTCYMAAWDLSKVEEVSFDEAWKKLKPRGWKPEPPKPVVCCMPWCDISMKPTKASKLDNDHFLCLRCRTHLYFVSCRAIYDVSSLRELAKKVLENRIQIPAPGEPEMCIMPWCDREEHIKHRGPRGEPLCNSDHFYLRNYSRRMDISFAEAIETAPPPRLLHTRT